MPLCFSPDVHQATTTNSKVWALLHNQNLEKKGWWRNSVVYHWQQFGEGPHGCDGLVSTILSEMEVVSDVFLMLWCNAQLRCPGTRISPFCGKMRTTDAGKNCCDFFWFWGMKLCLLFVTDPILFTAAHILSCRTLFFFFPKNVIPPTEIKQIFICESSARAGLVLFIRWHHMD